MLPEYMRFLPEEVLARLGTLEIAARGVMQGFIAGKHRSAMKGFSVEFAEHREYVPGDDLRTLDWRLLARKDRYFVKQYVEETNMRVTMLLDASGSMAYTGELAAKLNGRRLSKLEYAQHVAAILGHILLGQQDAVGLVTFDHAVRGYLPPRARKSQMRAVLELLHETQAGGDTKLADVFHEIAERIPRRGMVIILSDLFDEPAELIAALHHFCFRRHQVLLCHVVAREELSFPFEHYTNFRGLEGKTARVPIDPRGVRMAYLKAVQEYLTQIKEACGHLQIEYLQLDTSVPYDQMLSNYARSLRA